MNYQSLKTFFVLLLSTSATAKSETFDTFVGGEICVPSGYAATDPAWGDDGNISVSIPSEMLKNIIPEYDFSIARVQGIQNYGGDSWSTVHLFIYGKDYESEHMSTTNWLWSQYFSKKSAGYSFEPFQNIGFRVYDDGYKDTWLVVKYATTEKPKSSDWLIGWCSKGDRDRKEASWCKVEFEHKGLFFRAQFLEKNLPIKKQVISGLTQIIDSWREQCHSR